MHINRARLYGHKIFSLFFVYVHQYGIIAEQVELFKTNFFNLFWALEIYSNFAREKFTSACQIIFSSLTCRYADCLSHIFNFSSSFSLCIARIDFLSFTNRMCLVTSLPGARANDYRKNAWLLTSGVNVNLCDWTGNCHSLCEK